MRRKRWLSSALAAILGTLSANIPAAVPQQGPAGTPVRAVLALTTLQSVVEAPLFFKLSRVELPARQSTAFSGPVGFVYVLSGSIMAQSNAGRRNLRESDALLVAADTQHSFSAAQSEPAIFLHFVLARSGELDRAREQPPANVSELYRNGSAIPHLGPGPYEFTLTQVTFPARMAPNIPHYRSGAALYYILSGSGVFIADGKSESKEMGKPHFEQHGWVHQWGNPGDRPLILLQANISQEGVPAVIMGQPASSPQK